MGAARDKRLAMRVCPRCGKERGLEEFKQIGARGQKKGACVWCDRRRLRCHDAESSRRKRAWSQRYAKRHPGRTTRSSAAWGMRHAQERRNIDAVRCAKTLGLWRDEPCAICLSEENVRIHHLDPQRPFFAIPLCAKAHGRIHAAMQRAEERERRILAYLAEEQEGDEA